MNEKLKVILTGATGMVGEGVLYECLQNDNVAKILVLTRKATGYTHPKLTEVIHEDFFDISDLSRVIEGYDSCFFCLGVTSLGKKEPEYTKITHTLTLNFAQTLLKHNPGMTFCYVSGAGTDSSEKGNIMWARVKGRTENDLLKLPFKRVFNFRPAGIQTSLPVKPAQTYYKTYKYVGWLFPIMKRIAPNYVTSLKDLAFAMVYVSSNGYPINTIEAKDMNALGKSK
jgi:uncharacterized protein YbjT (DUF2867 family)